MMMVMVVVVMMMMMMMMVAEPRCAVLWHSAQHDWIGSQDEACKLLGVCVSHHHVLPICA